MKLQNFLEFSSGGFKLGGGEGLAHGCGDGVAEGFEGDLFENDFLEAVIICCVDKHLTSSKLFTLTGTILNTFPQIFSLWNSHFPTLF